MTESSAPTELRLRPGDQQLPVVNDHPDIQSQVIADIEARREVGIERYGTALQPFNGRNALRDLYEELLDAATYIKQCIVEQDQTVEEPLLGLATTEQLIEELHARALVGGYLHYRTVDGHTEIDASLDIPTQDVALNPDLVPGLHIIDGEGVFVTGVGQVLRGVHHATECVGRHCVIHDPSDHHLIGLRTQYRFSGPFDIKPPHMERLCEHGVGHPDPDDAAYWMSNGEDITVHGCCGCCATLWEKWRETHPGSDA